MAILTKSQYRKLGLLTFSEDSSMLINRTKRNPIKKGNSSIDKVKSHSQLIKGDKGNINTRLKRTESIFQNEECPICYDIMKRKDEFMCYTCKQRAHKICFEKSFNGDNWQRRNCPFCRSMISKFD